MINFPLVLIHSPLVGSLTWEFVAAYLREQGCHIFVPELIHSVENDFSFWEQEIAGLDLPMSEALFIGHSGAGALLPAVGKKFNARGYIFIDAVLLFNSASRLDLLRVENAEFAQKFEQYLQGGGRFPNWTDESLKSIIPDSELRQRLIDDLRPRSIEFFTEQIQVPVGWDTKPCVYIQLSNSYSSYAQQAEERNWKIIRRNAHHFEMLTNPVEIGKLLIQISQSMGG